jgi:hypothetical protein
VGVEKPRNWNVFFGLGVSLLPVVFFISSKCGCHGGCCRLAEEPHQLLEVLGRRCFVRSRRALSKCGWQNENAPDPG